MRKGAPLQRGGSNTSRMQSVVYQRNPQSLTLVVGTETHSEMPAALRERKESRRFTRRKRKSARGLRGEEEEEEEEGVPEVIPSALTRLFKPPPPCCPVRHLNNVENS